MLTKEIILEIAKKQKRVFARDLVKQFKISRQYVSILISGLSSEKKLVKIGSTKKAFYVLPEYTKMHEKLLLPRYVKKVKKGTHVTFQISRSSKRHLNDVFKEYTNIGEESDYGFDKTEIRVKLYTIGGVHISRSQARRVLFGLEKFKIIVFDFDKVPTVGQAFADEVFRVFHNKYPNIKLETENMAEGVKFMVERAQNEAKKLDYFR